MGTSVYETDAARTFAPGDQVGLSSQGPSMLGEVIRPEFFQEAESTFTNGSAAMAETFTQGSTELMQVGPAIEAASQQFGPIAGQGLLSVAELFGQRVGQAALAAIGNLNLNVNQPSPAIAGPRLDRGVNTPI
jgi:hypothetical protein